MCICLEQYTDGKQMNLCGIAYTDARDRFIQYYFIMLTTVKLLEIRKLVNLFDSFRGKCKTINLKDKK